MIAVRLPATIEKRLDQLAKHTGREMCIRDSQQPGGGEPGGSDSAGRQALPDYGSDRGDSPRADSGKDADLNRRRNQDAFD